MEPLVAKEILRLPGREVAEDAGRLVPRAGSRSHSSSQTADRAGVQSFQLAGTSRALMRPLDSEPFCSRTSDPAWRVAMFILVRAVTYATLFIGALLVFLPARILGYSGIVRPTTLGPLELAGISVGLAGALLAVGCILTFALVGKGTPAPFDPPQRLVVNGPYRYVRNPMYLGAAFALGGAALVYRSVGLLIYAAVFHLAMHLFVLGYEEPALTRLFGTEYQTYRTKVHRWLPRIQARRR